MADRKVLFVNANGEYEEVSQSAGDAILAGSFKTANWELTDSLLGDVTNLMIKSDGSRAFAADQSMGGNKLTNLADGTSSNDAVNYSQLQAAVNGFDWKQSVRAATTAALPAVTYANGTGGVGATLTANANGALAAQDGVTLVVNDRLLVKDQAAGLQNGIYIVTQVGDGSNPFILTRAIDADQNVEVTAGLTVAVEEGSANVDRAFILTTDNPITLGTTALAFVKIVVNHLTGGAGVTFVGETISLDLLSGGGLKEVGVGDAGQLAVEPADFAGDGLVDDGSDNLAIDWATVFTIGSADAKAVKASDLANTGSGKGAKIIGINDAGNYTATNNVEDALQELYALSGAKQWTVDTGGVTKGDLVYISANDKVKKLTSLTGSLEGVGLALSTQLAAAVVEVKSRDYVVPGVLSGATAGTKYYWDGSALVTSIPSGAGAQVWFVGTAANATDLLIDVEFVKKNAA